MDKLAVMKSDAALLFGESRRTEEASSLNGIDKPPTSVIERCQETTQNGSPNKFRKYGYVDLYTSQISQKCISYCGVIVVFMIMFSDSRSRLGGVKVRHKRQVLQDMARPLKHWLYKHRDNPYPTKTEKVLLALGSHMTLVQVKKNCLNISQTY